MVPAADALRMQVVGDPATSSIDTGASNFGEKLLVMPGSYQPQDPFMMSTLMTVGHSEAHPHPLFVTSGEGGNVSPADSATAVSASLSPSDHRRALGIPKSATVLACFNRVAKVDPTVWSVWVRGLGGSHHTQTHTRPHTHCFACR